MQQLTPFHPQLCRQYIVIDLQQEFDDETMTVIAEQILQRLADHHVIEIISGADRVNYRLHWAANHYVLNFEIYSQSCWLEVESGLVANALLCAYKMLIKEHPAA